MCAMMQALLDEWRDELSRKPLGMSEADACAILQITPDENGAVAEEDLKQARGRYFLDQWRLHSSGSQSICLSLRPSTLVKV